MTRSPLTTIVPLLALLAAPTAAVHAATFGDELSDLREAISFGKVSGAARARYEHVDQDNLANTANAATLRLALGYETKAYHGLSGFLQFEGVFGLNGDDHYRSVSNTLATFPRVADQASVEMNQAYAQYVYSKDPWKTQVRWGRQEINLGNQRLVGAVAWRQDTQTYDGGSVTTTPWNADGKSLALGYNYIYRVNRIFPDNNLANPFQGRLDMDTHLGQALFKWDGIGQLHAYGLFLDYDDYGVAVTNLSSSTIGARASGAVKASDDISVLYGLEYAQQSDYGTSTQSYDAAYYQGELGATYMGFTLRYGYSVMEGSDTPNERFTTPLATLHAFDGWVDMFLNTPMAGLVTHQVTLSYNPPMLKGLTVSAIYYDFSADANSDKFGTELNFLAEYRLASFPGLLVGAKYGQFEGDDIAGILAPHNGAEEVTKFWLYTQYSF